MSLNFGPKYNNFKASSQLKGQLSNIGCIIYLRFLNIIITLRGNYSTIATIIILIDEVY